MDIRLWCCQFRWNNLFSSKNKKRIDTRNCSNSDSKSHDHANKNMNENSNSNEDCQVISNLLLPEDLIIYILTLVPLNCLIKSGNVCKSWATTIHSPHFAELYERRQGHSRSKLGLYVDNHMSKSSSYFLEFKDDDVNGQFERTDLEIPPRMGHVIGTCDGILLLWNYKETFVVNPIIKCWLRVPPFPSSRWLEIISTSAIDTACTIIRVPRTAKFKLFDVNAVVVSRVVWYICYVLRIGIDNSWKEIARKQSPPTIYLDDHCQGLIFSGNNELYWITRQQVIVMDVDREIILREYRANHVWPSGSYLITENRLSSIVPVVDEEMYEIYFLDFDSGKWSRCYAIKIRPIDINEAAYGRERINIWSVVFRFWINDHILLRVSLAKRKTVNSSPFEIKIIHCWYNVKTKQFTKMKNIDVGTLEVWLHTNSLATLPSSPV